MSLRRNRAHKDAHRNRRTRSCKSGSGWFGGLIPFVIVGNRSDSASGQRIAKTAVHKCSPKDNQEEDKGRSHGNTKSYACTMNFT